MFDLPRPNSSGRSTQRCDVRVLMTLLALAVLAAPLAAANPVVMSSGQELCESPPHLCA